MTMKSGLRGGAVAGLLGWLVINGYLTFTPAPLALKELVELLAFGMLILSIIAFVASAIQGSEFFGTTGDGVIYGFTLVFDILYVLTQLYSGHLPLP